jgi:hypothetical protein
MANSLRKFHKFFGIFTLVVFALTGLYMRLNIAHIDITNEKLRMMFRANHIYIMFAGIINIGLGSYLNFNKVNWKKRTQEAGSIFIILATLALIAAFFLDPVSGSLHRSKTRLALISFFLGGLCHFFGGLGLSDQDRQ